MREMTNPLERDPLMAQLISVLALQQPAHAPRGLAVWQIGLRPLFPACRRFRGSSFDPPVGRPACDLEFDGAPVERLGLSALRDRLVPTHPRLDGKAA